MKAATLLPALSTIVFTTSWTVPASAVDVDLAAYPSDSCRIDVVHEPDPQILLVSWPLGDGTFGRIVFDLDGQRPLVRRIGIARSLRGEAEGIVSGVDPAFFLTVGSRKTPPGKPADQAWAVFFDNPARREHQSFRSSLDLQSVRVRGEGPRATVTVGSLSAGSFSGELEFSFYADTRLAHVVAKLTTAQKRRAFIYDAGLLGEELAAGEYVWTDTSGKRQASRGSRGPLAVRHRTLAFASPSGGALACFPPPHQFQFPRDWTNNLKFVWHGAGHRDLADRFGFGVRQAKTGGGNFVPWFDAPPGTEQRLGVFFLQSPSAGEALEETLRFTRSDSFKPLPGYRTFTTHWHMAIAVQSMRWKEEGRDPLPVPDFVGMFKDMGVDMVHLGEFHGDGHQKDPGPRRLPELEAMFDECRRLSDDELLMIPGEEVNTFLGLQEEGKHPGHWMSLFPRPVYWTMQPGDDRPFVEEHPDHGKVYHVGDREDMRRLIAAENALVWTAHPRIKASSWTPDIFRNEDFYLDDSWLGAAWKALPADLSRERLGWRPLELLDDMANWGQRKYLPGEVDVFKLDATHELFSHMNINYVRLDRLPRFDDGWKPVLDALRGGKFFVTTGEVLIREFDVSGTASGDTLRLQDDTATLRAELEWTFPLAFAEVVSGDGETVYRERIDLTDTGAFGDREFDVDLHLEGRRWVRFEVWDIATNGAFTQPVWIEKAAAR